jgi:hypothetical protein
MTVSNELAIYRTVEGKDEWRVFDSTHNPGLAEEYVDEIFEFLASEEILTPETASGFVLYSPSAYDAHFEYALAKSLDSSLSKQPAVPPLIVASDATLREPHPKFPQEDLRFVEFHKVETRAENPPAEVERRGATVIFDRLGALWHAQQKRLADPADGAIFKLLDVYKNLLRPKGVLIIDSAQEEVAGTTSTYNLLTDKSGREVDLEARGWERLPFIGQGKSKLAVLRPKTISQTIRY